LYFDKCLNIFGNSMNYFYKCLNIFGNSMNYFDKRMNYFKNTLTFFFKGEAKVSGTTICTQKVPSTNRCPYGPLHCLNMPHRLLYLNECLLLIFKVLSLNYLFVLIILLSSSWLQSLAFCRCVNSPLIMVWAPMVDLMFSI
jgi:hypothetical protein